MNAMRLIGNVYEEAPAPEYDDHPDGVCRFCALFKTTGCTDAIDGAATAAFGGDCEDRDVVYVSVPRIPTAAIRQFLEDVRR